MGFLLICSILRKRKSFHRAKNVKMNTTFPSPSIVCVYPFRNKNNTAYEQCSIYLCYSVSTDLWTPFPVIRRSQLRLAAWQDTSDLDFFTAMSSDIQ